MLELKILKMKGFEFSTDGKELFYKTNCNKVPQDPVFKAALFGILRNKKLVIELLRSPPKIPEKIVSIDIETSGDSPLNGKIRLITYCDENGVKIFRHVSQVKDILEDGKILKILHNASFDVYWLEFFGCSVKNYTDTMVISQVLNNKVSRENSLKTLAQKYLNVNMNKGLQALNNWNGKITRKHIQYAMQDAKLTYDLYFVMIPIIEKQYLEVVLQREIDALPVIIMLQKAGIGFDYKAWQQELQMIGTEIENINLEILSYFGNSKLNLNSPSQLKVALSQIGIDLKSTSDEDLAKVEEFDPIIKKIRKVKKLKKLKGTYGEKLQAKIGADGRIRGSWRLIGTDTSRMTCSSPNLQGMPGIAKPYFRASEGFVFVWGDFSQIELRVLAQITRDKVLTDAFNYDMDLHSITASSILGKLITAVTPDERKMAKIINFGLIYGMTAYGLHKKINAKSPSTITPEDAETFRNEYFKTYPNVLEFQNQMGRSEKISSLGGRYWYSSNFKSNRDLIKKFNYPVQASAGEGLKATLKVLIDKIPEKWKLVNLIHDEIVLEVPLEDEVEAKTLLREWMIEGMQKIIKDVKVDVEVGSGINWEK